MAEFQPVAAPDSLTGYRQLLAAGRLVDRAGRPLAAVDCPHCDGTTVGETCPQSLTCPSCRARPGRACRRPSGHGLMGRRWHHSRMDAAADTDLARERAGDLTVPARWPD